MATTTGTRTLRRALASFTHPLLPDDYTQLLHPLWSARELRGRVERVVPESEDAATLVIRPGWGWRGSYTAGQYVGIGVQVGGRWVWRSYSLTSAPEAGGGLITITVKAMPEGRLSSHLVNGLEPGTVVRLQAPQGEFVLPDPLPAKVLFWAAGSGVTPIVGMLRSLRTRGRLDGADITVVHSGRSEDALLFRDELRALSSSYDGVRLVERTDDVHGLTTADRLGEVVPDWTEREAWVCGPAPMLDGATATWKAAGIPRRLHVERFTVDLSDAGAEGGEVTFAQSYRSITVDGATTLLEAGERAGLSLPFGCRMGICHSCVVPLKAGRVRDLRSGTDKNPGEKVQTCISAAAGDCVLDI